MLPQDNLRSCKTGLFCVSRGRLLTHFFLCMLCHSVSAQGTIGQPIPGPPRGRSLNWTAARAQTASGPSATSAARRLSVGAVPIHAQAESATTVLPMAPPRQSSASPSRNYSDVVAGRESPSPSRMVDRVEVDAHQEDETPLNPGRVSEPPAPPPTNNLPPIDQGDPLSFLIGRRASTTPVTMEEFVAVQRSATRKIVRHRPEIPSSSQTEAMEEDGHEGDEGGDEDDAETSRTEMRNRLRANVPSDFSPGSCYERQQNALHPPPTPAPSPVQPPGTPAPIPMSAEQMQMGMQMMGMLATMFHAMTNGQAPTGSQLLQPFASPGPSPHTSPQAPAMRPAPVPVTPTGHRHGMAVEQRVMSRVSRSDPARVRAALDLVVPANERRPLPARTQAEATHRLRVVYLSGFRWVPLGEVRKAMVTLRFYMSPIKHIDWVGRALLELVVEEEGIPLLREHVAGFDGLFALHDTLDCVGQSPAEKEQLKTAFRHRARRVLEEAPNPVARAFFKDWLEERFGHEDGESPSVQDQTPTAARLGQEHTGSSPGRSCFDGSTPSGPVKRTRFARSEAVFASHNTISCLSHTSLSFHTRRVDSSRTAF